MQDPTIFYICNDPERALGLETSLRNYHILSIDCSPISEQLIRDGFKTITLATEQNTNPIFRSSSEFLKDPGLKDYIVKKTPQKQQSNVSFFKITPGTEREALKLGYKIINTSSDLNRKFEEKISQYQAFESILKYFPKTILSKLEEITWVTISEQLGGNVVIQYNRGHTGSGTIFVSSEDEFKNEQSKFPKRIARISALVSGDAWTINCCATRFGILANGLCYQITGVAELTDKPGATVGNDWNAAQNLPDEQKQQIVQIAKDVGEVMQRSGYKGLFGLDLIIDKQGRVFLIEINARQPASTPMHSKLMLKKGLIPLHAFHLAEFLYEDESDYLDFLSNFSTETINTTVLKKQIEQINSQRDNFNASQIFVRNTHPNSVKVSYKFDQGVYFIDQKIAEQSPKPAYCIDSLSDSQQIFILRRAENQIVSPGGDIARIQMLDGMIESKAPSVETHDLTHRSNGSLKESILNKINEIKPLITLTDIPDETIR